MTVNKIDKLTLTNLVEGHFEADFNSVEHNIITLNSVDLLTHNRFDLAFKLLYLDGICFKSYFSKESYKEHIRAFSLGRYTEPGNDKKNNIESFYQSFHVTYEKIQRIGFDSTESLIPLSCNGSILDGAHRLASAIHLGKKVSCIESNADSKKYDYRFFFSRQVPIKMLDSAATKFVEVANNIYIACIWPSAIGHDDQLEKVIPNIVYRKNVPINLTGAHNLLSQIYSGEKWLGDVKNNYKGVKGKLSECFSNNDDVRFIAFQASCLQEVLEVKECIREIFKIGKHSVHITDTTNEAIELAHLVFNDNALHFLNYGKPNTYINTHIKLNEFIEFMDIHKLNKNEVALDTGMLLALYGIRPASDIDYLSLVEIHTEVSDNIESHDNSLIFHAQDKSNLLLDPEFYFYFKNVKFICFNQVYNMKLNRGEVKDINDIQVMKGMLENNIIKQFIGRVKQKVFYTKAKLFKILVLILKRVGLFDFVYNLYKALK
ncbi:hypothetical protein FM037_09985 [Shewanella psychropiezotolerans]|uniref:ParB/Sulfiredoxin domain-containing protein n=1 Tax=Shewanella psychropiezotolerans TaxID=2593655 RepID=A0ABX5WYJ7_9GAMM|nr:hypothetical protein [Shewanella psychropiezotolerans]QDO83507.1 hypothetical protein FM037_09985 [Shewanella psychropiezotolerans]